MQGNARPCGQQGQGCLVAASSAVVGCSTAAAAAVLGNRRSGCGSAGVAAPMAAHPRPNPKQVAQEARKLSSPRSRIGHVTAAIERAPVPTAASAPTEEPKPEPEPEQQLVKMRMAVLKKLALNCGLTEQAIEFAEQHDNPKQVLATQIQKQNGWAESFQNSVEIGDGAPAVEVWRETALLYDLRAALHLEERDFAAALEDSDVSIVHAARAGAWSTGHEPHQRAALCCLRLGRLAEARRRVEALPAAGLPLMVQLSAAEKAVEQADASIAAVSVEQAAAAAELLQKVCRDMTPGSAFMASLLISTLIMSRNWGAVDKALAAAKRAHGSANTQLLVVRGRVLAHSGDSAAAAELYQKAVKQLPKDDPQYKQADRLLREHNRRMRQWMNAKVEDDEEEVVSRMGAYRDLRKRAKAVNSSGPRSPMRPRDAEDEALFSARLWAAAEALGSGRPATAAQADAAAAEAGGVSNDDYDAWRRWKHQGRERAKQDEAQSNPSRQRERDQATALRRAQSEKVAALRKDRAEADQRATEKQELQRTISVKLQRKIAGRSFPKVLGAFGVPVAATGGRQDEPTAMAKAYKKALIKYHPDRAARQGADFSIQLEMEETYKLLQNLHQEWQSQASGGGRGHEASDEDEPPPPSPASARRPSKGQGPGSGQGYSAPPPRSWTEAGATGGPAARAAAAASVAARAARAAAAAASAQRASTASRGGDRAHAQAVQREAAWRARWAAGAAREYGEAGRPMGMGAAGGGSGGGGMPFKQRSAYF
jgi:tetratricopeptide (TPR) repeat protein